jgi:hypothetical protein
MVIQHEPLKNYESPEDLLGQGGFVERTDPKP